MRKYYNILPLYLLLIISFGVSFSCTEKKEELFPEITLPSYPAGYSEQRGVNLSINRKYLIYKINMDFPAVDIINFYNGHFKKLHLREYSDDNYGTRNWENFNSASGEWEETDHTPARYIATWVDDKMKKRVFLTLRYKNESGPNEKAKILDVDCNVVPFFDLREVKKRVEKEETGKGK